MSLISIAIAWTLGIILAYQIGLDASLWGWLILAIVPGLFYARRRGQGTAIVWLMVAAMAGGWRYVAARPTIDATHLAHYNDQGRVLVEGYISAEPVVRDRYTQIEVTARQLTCHSRVTAVGGRLVANVPHYPEPQYGDVVRLV
ncbi:MAG TPA: DUF4131 domain-containing protein, partial [Chloroflexi bacterium]|nr:DUF4131 domain-containing protein [Chloroflexota bacterium]